MKKEYLQIKKTKNINPYQINKITNTIVKWTSIITICCIEMDIDNFWFDGV
jgi:hypothetical protein